MAKKRLKSSRLSIAAAFHAELLKSDDFGQYSLRATFFVRKLRGLRLWEAIREVEQLATVAANFDWTEPKRYGIEPEAWDRIASKRISPQLVFAHPRVIAEQPRLLLYYRTVAVLSQKGLRSLVPANVAKIEAGAVERLDDVQVAKLAIAINSIVSATILTAADIEESHLPGLQFAAAGATIQGSWNNEVGTAGETAVKTILLNHLRKEIVQIVWRTNKTTQYDGRNHTDVIDQLANVRVVRMKHGFHLLFASEPDISLRNREDVPLLAMEVKAGYDTAGALERLGAAMKSFEHDRDVNPRVKTVYVVRCMTPELQKRISRSNPFDYTFGLADLMGDADAQRTFANLVVRVMVNK